MPSALAPLEEVVDRLLGEGGCPWDRAQTLETLRPYLLEEAFEAVAAIDAGSPDAIAEELGDVLFLVTFLARLMERRHGLSLDAIAARAAEKMVSRHPWVFAGAEAGTVDSALADWEAQKSREKRANGRLAGVPGSLPALLRALRVGEKAGAVGYDFADPRATRAAIEAELAELDAADSKEAREHEVGDVLFATANHARKLGIDPESALRMALDRFGRRFRHAEVAAEARGLELAALDDSTRDALWEEAKLRDSPSRSGPE